jgi:hypothetical protein
MNQSRQEIEMIKTEINIQNDHNDKEIEELKQNHDK